MPARATRYFVKNHAEPSSEPAPVDVEKLGEGHYALTLDGHRFEVDSLVLPHGAVSMLVEGRSYSVEFEERDDDITVLLNGQLSRLDVVDERRLRLRAISASFEASGKQVVAAPMPGKVVKLLVKAGDAVEEGQGLVVVEAMKMENELKAPKAGTVTEVAVAEGATVENGARLVVVE